uniref:F-box domain-containing protein n=1 Tax=Homalodisca liturata TaxID=320908 RepID=A0A1B6J468_9HEMI
MKTGGKRKSVYLSTENSEENELNMSPKRKRSKTENNNSYKHDAEICMKMNMKEMGVGLLPTSDNEDEDSDSEIGVQLLSDRTDESSMDSLPQKSPTSHIKQADIVMITPPEQLLSYRSRRSVKNSCKLDIFSILSDEIVLMILQWLPKRTLSVCAMVCQRWRRVVYDESLWERIDLTNQVLRPDQVGYVLQRNPAILRMSQVEVVSPLFKEIASTMEDFLCHVQYLDLSMALISPKDLAELLGKCRDLKKLSLEHCITDTNVCLSIAANTELEVLNMSQCYQLDVAGLEEILVNCTELLELNLAWTRLDSDCIDVVCKLVNENIRQLNLSGCLKFMKDSHVKELVSRCSCITQLDLSDCTELTEASLEAISKYLCDIEQLSFSRCYNILPNRYVKLVNIKSLQYLNIFGLMHSDQLETYKQTFKSVQLNEQEFSTIARPTVGIRRTSIWGLRVRD